MRWGVLASILCLSLFLRWPLASLDVEHYAGPDEGEVVENVLEMLRMGDLDHRHRGYPGLHFYLQMAPLALHRAAAGRPIPELPRSGFYLLARRVTLVAGVLTALLTFLLGRRMLSEPAALLAASLVALTPLAARESAVVNPDLMLSFFVTLSLWLSVRLVSERSLARFALAGAAVGLAAAVKYTGAFAVAPYLCAWLLGSERRREAGRAACGLVVSAAVFSLVSPYTWVHLSATIAGLGTHASYYNAAAANGAAALARSLFWRGLGPPAALAALAGGLLALVSRENRRLVVLSFPVVYLGVFAAFGRAFPRHALVLLPPLALLAASLWDDVARRRPSRAPLGALAALLLLVAPAWGSVDLALRSRRPTPADRAKAWAETTLPAGTRVLQDQMTPRLDSARLPSHRLRVEEKVFAGNFDFAFVSGYPPGIATAGLREVQRFETEGALGSAIAVYQLPTRESSMPVTLALDAFGPREVGAGELPFFGEGWHPPRPGAFETSRLSDGARSELFFVLPRRGELLDLELSLTLGPAVSRSEVEVALDVNGEPTARFTVGPAEREALIVGLPASRLRGGVNRIGLGFSETERLDRRRAETAVRLYRFSLTWRNRDRLR